MSIRRIAASTGLAAAGVLLFSGPGVAAAINVAAVHQSSAPERYVVDPAHTAVNFAVRHLGLSKVRGSFSAVSGAVFYDSLRAEEASVTVLIETASIDTNNERRDDDLKANFFDAERFPWITFQSTRLERAGDGYQLHGLLGIRDSLRAVDFPVELLGGFVDDGSGERRVGFEGRLRIDRTHFGVVAPDHPAELRLVIGHDIEIELQVEARIPGYGGTTYASEDGRSIGEELEAVLEASGGAAAARERYGEIMAAPAGFDVATRELALLGFRRLQAGDTAGGVVAFELYADSQPSATADEWLGHAYLAAGMGREAARAYEKALAADPWRASAIEGLRRLRETTDRPGLPVAPETALSGG